MLRLDLGCGDHKKEGFIGVDKEKLKGVDVMADLDNRLPFYSNSVDEVRCWNVLEHIRDLDFTMNEIWRVCKPNVVVSISVPHFSGNLAFYEYHKRFFNIYSFQDYTETPRMKNNNNGKFEIVEKKIIFPKHSFHVLGGLWESIFNINFTMQKVYDETFLHWLIPAVEIHFTLKARKEK